MTETTLIIIKNSDSSRTDGRIFSMNKKQNNDNIIMLTKMSTNETLE